MARPSLLEHQMTVRWVDSYKAMRGCAKCGNKDHAVLEFHHRNRTEKSMAVSAMVTRGFPLVMIRKEIAKCDVMCANCHRRAHYDERVAAAKFKPLPLLPIVRNPFEEDEGVP